MNPLAPLVQVLTRLPGIGEKSAMRLALFLLRDKQGLAAELMKTLAFLSDRVRFCKICQNLTEEELCPICRDPSRDRHVICIVQEPVDLMMIEKTGHYRGLYHVLHGRLSPLEGIGPQEIQVEKLLQRLQEKEGSEVILAMNPNAEGEATALYLKKILTPLGMKITRIASGVPVGGTLEYTDPHTLSQALTNRKEY